MNDYEQMDAIATKAIGLLAKVLLLAGAFVFAGLLLMKIFS